MWSMWYLYAQQQQQRLLGFRVQGVPYTLHPKSLFAGAAAVCHMRLSTWP